MISKLRNSIIITLSTLFLFSCDNGSVYHSFKHVNPKGWSKHDTLSFEIGLKETAYRYNIRAQIRNLSSYAYQDLYLCIKSNIPDSTIWQTDTIKFQLINKEGEIIGKGWGDLYELSVPYRNNILVKPGKYTIKISHEMKDNYLKGINDVGIKVE
ncbi:gliding motility lipoprotein GldH [Bacteroides graminisolvens]|uniref:gliding motility lipoprotein GldH n=1 Tax=Bacteroides graminisolvens TaxID=477666 RepID=UPI0023F1B033|nr:gliding motility lipoprotein GldH [Bacteroides graminisolvens]MDD3211041.1 gliding motility lipoprotein GldH [Bacteroides graminisolvens]